MHKSLELYLGQGWRCWSNRVALSQISTHTGVHLCNNCWKAELLRPRLFERRIFVIRGNPRLDLHVLAAVLKVMLVHFVKSVPHTECLDLERKPMHVARDACRNICIMHTLWYMPTFVIFLKRNTRTLCPWPIPFSALHAREKLELWHSWRLGSIISLH